MISSLKYVRIFCKYQASRILYRELHEKTKKPPWNVVFFGNDEFALYSLQCLYGEKQKLESVLNILDVVTSSTHNPVWKFAHKHQLNIFPWPPVLTQNKYDIGLVVSFGHLIPESIINQFSLGMLNVHASLLPRWRGASPIVYALANGDKETGITIMRIRPKHFDIGEILYQEKVLIDSKVCLPDLHKKLGLLGASCLVETLKCLDERLSNCKPQLSEGATYAPKITPDFAHIKWNTMTSLEIYNLERALKTIYPLVTTWNSLPIKILGVELVNCEKQCKKPGFIEYDRNNKVLIIECANRTWLSVKKVGVQGKKVMSATDFMNGFVNKNKSKNCFE